MSVFGQPPFKGNRAVVQIAEAPLDFELMARVARSSGAPATCFTWPRTDGDFDVCCFSPAGVIQCCGHGLLAAAYVLHKLAHQGSCNNPCDSPCNNDKAESIKLFKLYIGQAEALQVNWQDGQLWLSLPRLRTSLVAVPVWTQAAFSHKPARAAIAGGEEGYLVLEYDPEITLAALEVVFDHIKANTLRAVIVTQVAAKDYDFLLRYFAPQYGMDEDAVTGSANRVLADYWARRTGAKNFRALQCSTDGGVVLMRLQPHYVEISGHLDG